MIDFIALNNRIPTLKKQASRGGDSTVKSFGEELRIHYLSSISSISFARGEFHTWTSIRMPALRECPKRKHAQLAARNRKQQETSRRMTG